MTGNIKNRPRLIFVSEYYPPANNAPGARFGPLIEALDKYFDVHVYTSKVSSVLLDKRVHCNIISFPGNSRSLIHRLILELLYSIETFFRLLFTKGDIYYITSPSFFNCIASYFSCIFCSRKYVVDIRDDYPRVFFDNQLLQESSIFGKTFLRIERNIYSKAFLVIAATEGLRKGIEEKYSGPIYLLRNGFSKRMFNYTNEKYESFTLVFHGNLGYYQDLELIIKVADQLQNMGIEFKVIVIGRGSEDHIFKSRKTPQNLEYMGSQDYENIPQIIRRAHVGLSFRKPGRISEDSFPVRTYEYIGVGLPIIVTPKSEAGTFVERNGIGYQFEPDDLDSIIKTIIQLKSEEGLYHSIVEKILRVNSTFSREDMSNNFAEFLTKKFFDLSTDEFNFSNGKLRKHG